MINLVILKEVKEERRDGGKQEGKKEKKKEKWKRERKKGREMEKEGCVCGEQSFISLLCYSRIKDFSNSSLK